METYSYSKIKTFLDCPYAFYKIYFEKDKDKLSHGTSEFGTFAHGILEKYFKGELAEYELLSYYLRNYDKEITSDFVLKLTKSFSKDFSRDYFNSGKEYFENFVGFENINILDVEYEFTECIDDKFNLTGKIDLIVKDSDNNLIVIDHKSKAKFKNQAEREEYLKQLYIYAFAVYKKYGVFPDKLIFNMIRKQNLEKFDFNIDKYNNTLDWIRKEVEEIESCIDFYPVKKGFYCDNFCPYREKCEYKLE